MHKGIQRFDFFLQQLQVLLNKAEKQKNPALWLYNNNARTPLFMLEGLSKLYIELHNKKKFTKLKEQFKLLEDVLGAIDYYDAFAKELATNKKVPVTVISYLQAQTREKIQSLNEILVEKKWLGSDGARIKKIAEKLSEADWMDEDREIKAIQDFYGEAIYDIIEFTQETGYHFDNMEADVHELRRKLRWLSIYPQALQGCVQLASNKTSPKYLSKYLTKAITTSSFNKMPDIGDCKHILLLEKKYFLALSWMIAALGELKDSGLKIVAIKEAFQQLSSESDAIAYKKVYEILGPKQIKLPALLIAADKISTAFFEEQNLENLIIGTREIK